MMKKCLKFLLLPVLFIALFNNRSFAASWDVSSATYEATSPTLHNKLYDHFIKSDGTKLYTVDFNGYANEYTLTTPWDITTASLDETLYVANIGSPNMIYFNPTGTKLFIQEFYGDSLGSYSLSTPWDISSATRNDERIYFSSYIGSANPYGGGFKPDGTVYYIIDSYDKRIYQLNLDNAWYLSNRSLDAGSFNFSSYGYYCRDIDFNSDGTKMYIVTDNGTETIWQFTLSTPYDVSSATYNSVSFSTHSFETYPTGLQFKPDGSKMYIGGGYSQVIYQYKLGDEVAPTITSISSDKTDGSYKVGDVIDIDVTFSENVTSTGDITVTLETGDTDRTCTFTISDSSTGTCNYTVQEGDTSLDLDATVSGTIKDAAENEMSNFTPTTGLAANKALVIDTETPTMDSTVSAIGGNSSVDITWTTSEQTSTQVEYGLTNNLGTSTSETNTSPRVTNHEVSISSLNTCTTYFYKAISKDAASNTLETEVATFMTEGCEVSEISEGEGGEVQTSGGSVDIDTDNGQAEITAPNSYYSENLTLQINKLAISGAPTSPNGKSLAEDNFFDLKALTSGGSEVTSFDEDLTFVISYGSDIESSFEESSLDVYRYTDGEWVAQSCTLDTSANTLTCSLSGFSTYAVYGNAQSSNSSGKITKDNRCHAIKPQETTWIRFEPMIKDGVNGMYITWTQYAANKVTIYIDDGTNTYPWEVNKTSNDGHEFLPNVQPWQNIKILPFNNCRVGDMSPAVSLSAFPGGWYNLK